MSLNLRPAPNAIRNEGNDIGEVVLCIENALLATAGDGEDGEDSPIESTATAMVAFIVDLLATQASIDVERRRNMLRFLAAEIAGRAEAIGNHPLDRGQLPAGIATAAE